MAKSTQQTPREATASKVPSTFSLWFEEAWHGWLRHVGTVLVLGVGFLLYKLDLLNERLAGLLLGLGIAIGALVLALGQARPHVKTSGQRITLAALSLVWACIAGYPILHGIFPGAALATGTLDEEGSHIQLAVPDGGKDIYIAAKLRGGGGAVSAAYKITARSAGGEKTIAGELGRSIVYGRVGRRGSSSTVTEHNEDKQYLGRTKGPVTLVLEEKQSAIDKGVTVLLGSAPVPPLLIMILAVGVLIGALVLDRVLDPKGRTNLGVSAAISLLFAIYYGFDQARPSRIVAPAVGSFFLALVAGGLGGWILERIMRQIMPEKRRRARS